MKARDKRTGEIVEVDRYGADGSYTVFRNSEGELMNLPVSFHDNYDEIADIPSVDWERRRYEIAKDLLQTAAVSVNASQSEWMQGMTYPKASAVIAVRYADALINELKKTDGT